MKFTIETMKATDWDLVRVVYLEGLATGNASFETTAPGWDSWNSSHLTHSRFVASEHQEVFGWAALSSVSDRCVYGGVAEVSIYVGETGRGKGVGTALMNALIESSEANGIWTLQAGIFPENAASVNLHLRNGFREIGRREKIGKHDGKWRDTLLFERRSKIVGI